MPITQQYQRALRQYSLGKITKEELLNVKKGMEDQGVLAKVIENLISAVEKKAEKGEKGEPGKDGIDGTDGKDGRDGKDGKGIKGDPWKDGKDGKNGLQGISGEKGDPGKDGLNGKEGSPDKPKDIVEKLESLKGTNRFDYNFIKNTPDLAEMISRGLGNISLPEPRIERIVEILVSDPNGDDITTGDGKAYFRVPQTMTGMELISVFAHLSTASTSGVPTIQLRNSTQGVDMLSTVLTIDALEIDSNTAVTPAVVDTTNKRVFSGDVVYVDIDVAGTNAKGLLVEMIFKLS